MQPVETTPILEGHLFSLPQIEGRPHLLLARGCVDGDLWLCEEIATGRSFVTSADILSRFRRVDDRNGHS